MDELALPATRTFGYTFAALCAALAARMWWRQRIALAVLFALLAAMLILVTATNPRLLDAPNRAWFRFGLLLSRITSPIVVGAMFLVIVTPLGILMRLIGRDRLLVQNRRPSYWVAHDPANEDSASFSRQF
jgi:hypothetical protein